MLIDKLQQITDIFDWIQHVWEHPVTQRRVALIILWVYLLALACVELNCRGLLPPQLAALTPYSHFAAIQLALTLILSIEIMGLILSISNSISRALGKQFEILALILLRNAFKELSSLTEPVSMAGNLEPIVNIAVSGVGALCVFACLCLYKRLFRSQHFIQTPEMRMRYVMTKKMLALSLFIIFFCLAAHNVFCFITTGGGEQFFATIYTVLIFSDVALVLIAQRYMPTFHAVFRNSGFVIGTLLMRLALSAPSPWDSVVSVTAALYVVALTWMINYFISSPPAQNGAKAKRPPRHDGGRSVCGREKTTV
ncbi:hypothetical protein AGMMS49974_03740 [Deltaproteobacteria bacterium]|nr:hypothetical protein AGMMS49974_03740 [Deltaproteobacteria bacterium]